MRIGRSHRQQDEITVDLTPMLDVVFIMLIFFIVSSTFVHSTMMDIQRPEAVSGIRDSAKSLIISVSAQNQYAMDNQPINDEAIQHVLHSHRLLNDQPKLIIDADKHAQNGAVIRLLDLAKQNGIEHIALATDTPK